jgi:hypothetical protein
LSRKRTKRIAVAFWRKGDNECLQDPAHRVMSESSKTPHAFKDEVGSATAAFAARAWDAQNRPRMESGQFAGRSRDVRFAGRAVAVHVISSPRDWMRVAVGS